MVAFELLVSLSNNVTLKISFENLKEAEERFGEYESILKLVSEKLGETVKLEPRSVKPTIDHVCRFIRENQLEFLQSPRQAVDAIGLVLYAYDPVGLKTADIAKYSKVANPSPYLTGKDYREYFIEDGEGYGLSIKGHQWIESVVAKDYPKPPVEKPSGDEPSNLG